MSAETDAFIAGKAVSHNKDKDNEEEGCCHKKATFNCCIATAVFGGILVALGLVALFLGKPMLEEKILKSMALTPGSDRYNSWLTPPVQPHLYGYAFNVTNPDGVLRGEKPVLQEVGPYVYKSTTVKDSDNNVVWHDEDGTMSYRPRKVYVFSPELTGAGLDPFTDMVTVPNIPLWTGLNKLKGKSALGRDIVLAGGLGTPFVTVKFDGLLWGYNDELPCLKLDKPSNCVDEDDPFGGGGGFSDDSGSDDGGFGDDDEWDFKRKKRNADDPKFNPDEDENSEWYGMVKQKAGFVDCKCEWGLFRDRNITMRKQIRFMTGQSDLDVKGWVTEYDGKKELNWWKKGSACDAVKGQDSSTLPPQLRKDQKLEIYIALMCRTVMMEFEKPVEHAGIQTYRYIPPKNALGAHDDPDETIRNPDNECYCLKDENFRCFKSGVMNMEPCKRDVFAPLALSMPHFYQADQSFRDAVEGLNPDKEKHQFYIDAVPEFGFPLAIRPRFQLNVIIGKSIDPGWDVIANMADEIVLPFLWAQDGFDEPSDELAEAIAFGLAAPEKLPLLIAVVLFALGGLMLLGALGFFIWRKKSQSSKSVNVTATNTNNSVPMKAI